MTRNPYVEEAVHTLNAAMAWGAKRHELRPHPDGLEIIRRGKPAILITHTAAREWANEIEEARHG